MKTLPGAEDMEKFFYHLQSLKDLKRELSSGEAAQAVAEIFISRQVPMKGLLPQEQREHYMKRAMRILSKKGFTEEQIRVEKRSRLSVFWPMR
ncbi:MAG: hypothetical protein WCC06_02655 [Candidatus Aminicenantales bacterium]